MLVPYTKYERSLYKGMKSFYATPGFMQQSQARRVRFIKVMKALEKRYEAHMRKFVAKKLTIGEDVTDKNLDVKRLGGVPSGYKNEDGYDDFAYSRFDKNSGTVSLGWGNEDYY